MDIETGGTIVPTRLEKERKSKDEVKKRCLVSILMLCMSLPASQ